MSKRFIILLIAILLLPFTLGYDLSDFPAPFLLDKTPPEQLMKSPHLVMYRNPNATIVVGETAPYDEIVIIGNIRSIGCPPIMPAVGSCTNGLNVEFDSKLRSVYYTNLISVGGPCANTATAIIMDWPTTWPECAKGFDKGTAIIRLYNRWDKYQLVIAGYNAFDTRKAIEILSHYKNYNFSGTSIQVYGGMEKVHLRNLSIKVIK